MEHLSSVPLGQAVALIENLTLGWEGLVRKKHSSLLQTFENYGRKKFHNMAPVANIIKLFRAVSYAFSLQARAFVPGKPFQPSLMYVGKPRCLT
jgi:hypothetical protein